MKTMNTMQHHFRAIVLSLLLTLLTLFVFVIVLNLFFAFFSAMPFWISSTFEYFSRNSTLINQIVIHDAFLYFFVGVSFAIGNVLAEFLIGGEKMPILYLVFAWPFIILAFFVKEIIYYESNKVKKKKVIKRR